MTKKKGRPVGATAKETVETVCFPAICPTCNGTNLKRLRGNPVQSVDEVGELPNGFRFSKVVWADHECDCGQKVRVRSYYPGKSNA